MILTYSLTILFFMLMGKRNLKLNLNYKPMAIILSLGQNITKMQIHYDKTSCVSLGSRHRIQNEASKLDITIGLSIYIYTASPPRGDYVPVHVYAVLVEEL